MKCPQCGLILAGIRGGIITVSRGEVEIHCGIVYGMRCYRCGEDVSINLAAPTPATIVTPTPVTAG